MYSPSQRSDTYRRHWLTASPGLSPPAAKRTPPRRSPDWLESTTRPTGPRGGVELIFSQGAAVEELIRHFAGKGLADELDFDTLEPLPTDRISGAAWSNANRFALQGALSGAAGCTC